MTFTCDQCGFETETRMAMVGHMNRKDHRSQVDDPQPESPEPPQEPEPTAEAPPTPGDVSRETSEVSPRKPRLIDRIRSRRGRAAGGGHSTPATSERPPRRRKPMGRRTPLDTDISDIWAFAGRRLERTPHFPTGRMLEYQAPAAGVIIDRAIANTLPDRILFQPIARNRDKYEDVGFLLAGPLLTFSITSTGLQMQQALADDDRERFEELAGKLQMQREMFVWVLRAMLPRLAEGKKRAEEKKAKSDAAIADAFPELGGEDPVEVLATMLFEPPSYEEASQNGKSHQAAGSTDPEGSMAV